jgi:hypothetical protein
MSAFGHCQSRMEYFFEKAVILCYIQEVLQMSGAVSTQVVSHTKVQG